MKKRVTYYHPISHPPIGDHTISSTWDCTASANHQLLL